MSTLHTNCGIAVHPVQQSDCSQTPCHCCPVTYFTLTRIFLISLQEQHNKDVQSAEQGHVLQPSLLKVVFKAYGWQYLALGFLKLANDILNFAGPLLLNALVQYLDHSDPHAASTSAGGHRQRWLPKADGLQFGLYCTALVGVTSLVKARPACCIDRHSSPRIGCAI